MFAQEWPAFTKKERHPWVNTHLWNVRFQSTTVSELECTAFALPDLKNGLLDLESKRSGDHEQLVAHAPIRTAFQQL